MFGSKDSSPVAKAENLRMRLIFHIDDGSKVVWFYDQDSSQNESTKEAKKKLCSAMEIGISYVDKDCNFVHFPPRRIAKAEIVGSKYCKYMPEEVDFFPAE
jgi:hypothetical protein